MTGTTKACLPTQLAQVYSLYLGLIHPYGLVQLDLTEARLASVSTVACIEFIGVAISRLISIFSPDYQVACL